jgi:hypothetical protein
MALITGWRLGRGATEGITPTRSIAVGVDLTEHAKAVRQLAHWSAGHQLPCGHRVAARPILDGLHHEYRLELVAA